MRFVNDKGALVFYNNGETVRIEAWSTDSLRVRATMRRQFTDRQWALTEPVVKCDTQVEIGEEDFWTGDRYIKVPKATITNGRIKAVVNFAGVISFYKDDKLILREYYRCYGGTISKESRCLKIVNREWKGIIGSNNFTLNLKFESNEGEKYSEWGSISNLTWTIKAVCLSLPSVTHRYPCRLPYLPWDMAFYGTTLR